MTNTNPFDAIHCELSELKVLVKQMLTKPKEDLSSKMYTIKEAAILFRVDKQTVENHIKRGGLKANKFGGRKLIKHYDIFNTLEEVKSLKYQRQV